MKFLVLLVCLFSTVSSSLLNNLLDDEWNAFKVVFNKTYDTVEEELERRLIWEDKYAKIAKHNLKYDLGLSPFKQGINEYADLAHKDFVRLVNGFKSSINHNKFNSTWTKPLLVQIPLSVDWVKLGFVTPVQDQGQCGSCWSFSAVGSLEGQHKKQTGVLDSLSEQNLIDCSVPEGNNGCQGGSMDAAFMYVKENNGIDTFQSYPYTAEDGSQCLFKRSTVGATCTGYVNIPSGNEDDLLLATAAIGPISVAIDAGIESFMSYQEGIYVDSQCSKTSLDHGVLVVGYGSQNGTPYWLIKNSWGTSWGINGYMMMLRGENMCGIATQASFPTVVKE